MRVSLASLWCVLALASACSNSASGAGSSISGTGSGVTTGGTSGGGSTGGATDLIDGGIPEGANAWAAAFSELICAAIDDCPATALGAGVSYQDQTTCVALETAESLSISIEPQPGEVSTPAARLAQSQVCLDDLRAVLADAGPCAVTLPFIPQYNQPQPASCTQGALAIGGTLTPGEPCLSAFQCSSNRCERGGGCGVCGPPSPKLDGGAACVQYDDCAPGLICSADRCRTFVAQGQACRPGDLCAPLTRCIDGTCQQPFVAGQSCIDGGTTECESQVCGDSRCAALPIVPIGSICGYSTKVGGYVLCDTETSVCDVVDTQAQAGYCIARKAIGERCFVSKGFDGDDCVAGASCLEGRCESEFAACLADGGLSEIIADAGPISLPDASGDYAGALAASEQGYAYACEGLANCPALLADEVLLGGSAAACEAAELPIELSALNAPGTDPAALLAEQTACNADLAGLAPCLAASFLITGYDSPACPWVMGTLPAGAACASALQCASGNCSTYWTGSGCGVCGNAVDAGGSCFAQTDCAGQDCAEEVCVAWGQFDAGCSPAAPCAPQFICLNGQCSGGLPAGASCSPSNPLCNPDLFCNAVTDECEAQIVANADAGMNDAGELDCGTLRSGAYAICPVGSACQLTNATSNSGICVPSAAPGSPCITTGSWAFGSSNCDWPASCVNGICGPAPLAVCQ